MICLVFLGSIFSILYFYYELHNNFREYIINAIIPEKKLENVLKKGDKLVILFFYNKLVFEAIYDQK